MRIPSSVFSLLSAIAVMIAIPSVGEAQLTITLEGSVRNTSGEPVAGAVVGVVNPATNERRGVNTNDDGRFRVLGLAPGRYEVTVRAINYEQKSQLVELLLGQRANLVFDLQPSATQLAAVAVTADRTTTVEVQRTSVSAPVVQQMIEQLPTIDRNIMTLAAVTPGVRGFAPQAGRALPSAGAMPELRFSNFYLDGIELKSLFNGNLVGIPQTGAPLPQEAIQEFRVFINPYDAEYSHAGAYVISAESNRGTNDTRGAVFGFFQDKSMVARTNFQTVTPDFNRMQLGANISGPIQRDRLFYAVNYEVTDSDNFIDVVPGRPASNPAVWDALRGSFKAPNLNHTGFLRGTYTPSERNTFDVSWSTRYMTGESNFGGTVARNGGIDQSYFINVAQLRHRYLPTPNLLNELSLQMVKWHHDEGMLVEREQRVYPSVTQGTATFPLELNETHLRLINRMTYTKDNWGGSHAFKLGAEVSRINADQFSPNFRMGSFRFTTDTSTNPNQATIGIGYQDRNGVTDAKAELSGWITGFYLNDEWRPTATLTVNLGLRYDAEINTLNNDFTVPWASDTAITNKAALANYINRGDRKNDLNNLSPRISFSWDPIGTNRTFIRGGFGVIYDRVASFIGFQERLAAAWRSYTIANPATMDVALLRAQVIAGTVPSTPNIILVKNKMEAPENRQMSIGLGHQFSEDLALNVDYVHQDVRHLYNRLNANYLNTQPNPDVRVLTPNYGDIILWDDFARAKYDAVMLSVNYRRGQLLTNLAYTLGFAKADYDAVTAPAFAFRSAYNMQQTAGDERHRIVLSEVADFAWLGGFQVAGIVTLASPRPFNAFIGQDLNFDNDFTDDFFPSGSPTGERTIRPGNAWKNWYRNVDIRLGKSLFAAQGSTVRLTAEVFNLFNTDNVASYGGRQKTAAGVDITNFGQATGAFGARRAQVGARVEF
ncbi:MAG TPA: carboxypeptidase regulatory-like domain-containing protein [Gemmatimonadaceae bacterium]